MPRFGDIGIERTPSGERRAMFISDGQIFLLSSDIEDDPSGSYVGQVTWPITSTDWIDPETDENGEI